MTVSLRIAVADDEPDMRDYYACILPRLGHTVVVLAATGAELVEQSRKVRPDLVITDVRMPDMDGIEAAFRLHQDSSVPVVLVSATRNPDLIPLGQGDHIVSHLVKPIKQADLAPAIAEAMRRFAELHGEM
jgi:response regulator NasT